MSLETRARIALETCGVVHAPDDRTCCFDLDVQRDGGGRRLRLAGTVETEHLLESARSRVRDATGATVDASDVTVLESNERIRTTGAITAPVRAAPEEDAEQVTKALYGSEILGYDGDGGWTRVRVADGYLGWTRSDHLKRPESIDVDAFLADRIERDDGEPLPLGCGCEVLETTSEGCLVAFRTGDRRRVPRDAVTRIEDPPSVADAIACARSFLGTTYEWGGMTHDGIDCSGLAWVAYRSIGVTLPRDADQQREVGTEVSREELAPGDLLFFPGHVAISLGDDEYVHAYGDEDGVVTNSLDPDAPDYLADLDDEFAAAKRVVAR